MIKSGKFLHKTTFKVRLYTEIIPFPQLFSIFIFIHIFSDTDWFYFWYRLVLFLIPTGTISDTDWYYLWHLLHLSTGCPKKPGNSVTNWISSLLWISIVIPNFKSHNIIMSARIYFMKRVKDCKDVVLMSPPDEQWRRTSLLCL